MKNFTRLLTWAFLLTMVIAESCSKGGTGGGGNPPPPPPPPPPGASLTVIPSKTGMFADGWEEVSFVVKNQNNQDVTATSQIYIDNALYTRSTFWTTTGGTYKIKALNNGITSPEVNLVVTDPGASPFSQKILVEDYTGTWCQYCPRVSIALENYVNAGHPNCIVIANHGGSGGGAAGTLYGPDPYTFTHHSTMANNVYGSAPAIVITGYPNAFVDRDFKWTENLSQLNTQFTNRRPPLGVGFQTSVTGNTIEVTAKVKFDVTTNADMKLVIYLVEDGIVRAQVNAPSNGNGLPNPIPNYIHNGVMRATGMDIYGELVPKASQIKGTTYDKMVSFNAASYNISNCRIVAFVVVGANNQNHKGVLNIQTVKVGENKDFD